MDSITPNQSQPSIKPNVIIPSSPRLVVIFIIIGVLISIISIFIANYFFNFLPFAWLPHQATQTKRQGSSIPQKVKNDISTYIKDSLKPTLIPANFEIRYARLKQAAINQNPNQFTVSLNNGNIVEISATYNRQFLVENRNISITLPLISTPSATTTATLTAQYLTIKPQGTWKCNLVNLGGKTAAKTTICENFWTDAQQTKHGVGVMSPLLPNFQNTSIFACELYPQGFAYSWKSCNIYNR